MEIPESQNAKDARVERLWKNLDIRKQGELDAHDLQKGLRKIDHREHDKVETGHTAADM